MTMLPSLLHVAANYSYLVLITCVLYMLLYLLSNKNKLAEIKLCQIIAQYSHVHALTVETFVSAFVENIYSLKRKTKLSAKYKNIIRNFSLLNSLRSIMILMHERRFSFLAFGMLVFLMPAAAETY